MAGALRRPPSYSPSGRFHSNSLLPVGSVTHCFGHAVFHFLGGNVFDVRGDRPYLAERVTDGGNAVAVELVFYGADELSTATDGFLRHSVHVFDVEVEAVGSTPGCLWTCCACLRILVGKHNDRVADL